MSGNTLSLYLHIPFCTTRCTYCAFNTYVNVQHLIPSFVDALSHEIEIAAVNNPYPVVSTVYFGGGTPSLLSTDQIGQLLDVIRRGFNLTAEAEVSIECNPNDLSEVNLQELHELGVNRLSIGMQSANTRELDLFARHHDNDTVLDAFAAARSVGFANLNLDLIYGFPHQTMVSWKNTLRQVLDLNPEHLSLYALGLEEGTPMFKWVEQGRLPVPDDDLAADMYELATAMLGENGYQQYEISNWSKPGFYCMHNLQYWRNLAYLGLGPGAHGYAANVRYATILSPQRFIKVMLETNGDEYEFPRTPATDYATRVSKEDEIAETLIMGLRLTREGIRRDEFQQRFGVDLVALHNTTLSRFRDYGLLEINDDVVRVTERGRLLSNLIFRELVEPAVS